MVKKIGVLVLALILLLTVLSRLALAQFSGYLESRLSRLESDTFVIRSELSRLQAQVYQLTNRSTSVAPGVISPQPTVTPRVSRPVLRSDPTYDRLANLVIELRERLNKLEVKVATIEKKLR